MLKKKGKIAAIIILLQNGKISADIEEMIRVYQKQLRLGKDPNRWKHVYFVISHVDYDPERHRYTKERWVSDLTDQEDAYQHQII